jgi:hypothetical protein
VQKENAYKLITANQLMLAQTRGWFDPPSQKPNHDPSEASSVLLSAVMPDGERYFAVPYHGNERLFNFNTGRYYRQGIFSKRQNARYSRLKSGISKAVARKERVCFLTLSTAYEKAIDENGIPLTDQNGHFVPKYPSKYREKLNGLNYAFEKLRKIIEWYWANIAYQKECKNLNIDPYLKYGKTERKRRINYPLLFKNCLKYSKLKYYKVKTSEGGGVLHIIFRKDKNRARIPKEFIHKQWLRIWGTWNSSISQVCVNDANRLSRYLIGQYFSKQPVLRMSYGHQWVFKGFSKSFKHVIEVYANMRREQSRATKQGASTFKQSVYAWNQAIKAGVLPKTGYQQRFRQRKYPKYAYSTSIEVFYTNGLRIERVRKSCKNPDKYALRYPKSCYQWLYDDSGDKTIQGRQIKFPKGKICLSIPMNQKITEQSGLSLFL